MPEVKQLSITLYEEDVEIIDDADRYGAGRSATLRRIIREWALWRPNEWRDERAPYHTSEGKVK